jgi:hypothetical protein
MTPATSRNATRPDTLAGALRHRLSEWRALLRREISERCEMRDRRRLAYPPSGYSSIA